jgi:hypothetical protein
MRTAWDVLCDFVRRILIVLWSPSGLQATTMISLVLSASRPPDGWRHDGRHHLHLGGTRCRGLHHSNHRKNNIHGEAYLYAASHSENAPWRRHTDLAVDA